MHHDLACWMLAAAAVVIAAASSVAEPEDTMDKLKTDRLEHEGQASIRVATPMGTWIYHEKGAGFASLIDADGRDWISYHPKGGSDGKFRGIPNLVHPEGHFHPGYTGCTTKIAAEEDGRVRLESRSKDGKWASRWDILPDRAVLTVVKADKPYWFLYEGTPGGEIDGKLDVADGFCLRSDGTRTPLAEKWSGDIAGDGKTEWVAFGNTRSGRTLLLIHHADDEAVDSYWPMQGNMTVFGFGRDGMGKKMTAQPNVFTVALVDTTDSRAIADAAAKLIETAPAP